jgi:putative tryptophan/tyrosine transport system substrate-binding protein
MKRRDFIAAISAAALARPFGAAAQQSSKVWRIGHLLPSTPTPEQAEIFARELEQRLAEFGYVQGRNIVLLNRFAGPRTDQIEQAVISLVPQVDLLVVWGNGGLAGKKFAGAVPTVFISIGFPVELGLVQSLAHPGGNITGIAAEAALEIDGKRLQILKEIVPSLKRVAFLRDTTVNDKFELAALDQAARELGVTVTPVGIKSADDLEGAFVDIQESRADALFVARTALTFNLGKQIADLALAAKLPSCHSFRPAVLAGGLMSLDADRVAMIGSAAAQIDKIIKGTNPADIPVEQPTRFDLYINLRTARVLNLTIPPNVLALADEVIE